MEDNQKKIDELIKAYKQTIDQLEEVKGKSDEEINNTLKAAVTSGMCCGSCVAVSNICVPDATPSKCLGGCTVTSMLF